MRKKIIIIMTAIVLFGGFIAGYRNINQKYPARKVETAEKGESLEFLDGVKISANVVKWLSTEEQAAIYENSGIDTSKVNYDTKIIEVSVCLKNTTEEEKEVPITYLSLDNRRWNSNFSGTFDGQFRTLQFYGRKIRTRRRESSYVSV